MRTPRRPISNRHDALTRRALLAGAVGAAAGALAPGRASGQERPASSRQPGRGPSPVGARASTEQPRRMPSAISSRTPLQDLHGTMTPSDLHFERHHGGIPVVDPAAYRLLIHGMVERPLTFTLEDLRRFPSVTRICFLECSGNFGTQSGEATTVQELCGLTSQTEWTGVRLSTLLTEVGAQPQALWLLAEGQDAALMTRSIPVKDVLADAIVAYAQNGEALRPEQGYPVRLLLPGVEGNASVKWLHRVELAERPFMTREETSKYTDPLADGTVRQFSLTMDARSVITSPSHPHVVTPGWNEIRGIAWSGRGAISRVDVSTDGGRTWTAAELQMPVLPKAHTRFRLLWRWDGTATEIVSRAVDETGYVQPEWRTLQAARGRRTRYHLNPVVGWKVAADGRVRFGLDRVKA